MDSIDNAALSSIDEVPPFSVTIYLQLRYRTNKMAWEFCQYVPVEYQLDSALLFFNVGTRDHSFIDAIGILVDGKVYSDDEPFWRNLLVEGETYKVVYLRRPFWEQHPLVWAWDNYYNTPLIDAADIPAHSLRYTTTEARAQLVKRGINTDSGIQGPQACEHHYDAWNSRDENDLKQAKREGRFIDYDRMKLFHGSNLKED